MGIIFDSVESAVADKNSPLFRFRFLLKRTVTKTSPHENTPSAEGANSMKEGVPRAPPLTYLPLDAVA